MAAPTISLSQILGNANVTDGQLLFANIANTNSGGNANSHANLNWDSSNSVLTVKAGSQLGAFGGNTSNDSLILYGPTGGTQNVSIRFTDNGLMKARIGVQMNGSGSYMFLGTSNNYNSGVTNYALSINQDGKLLANASPLTNNQTQLFTGLSAVRKTSANLTTATLSNDSVLIVSVQEPGTYQIDCMLFFVSGNTTNTAMGFLADLAGGPNGGLSGQLAMSALIKNAGGLQSGGGQVYSGFVASSTTVVTAGADWIRFTGTAVTVASAGTLQVRWAQNFQNTSANLTLLPGSYLTLTKVGP